MKHHHFPCEALNWTWTGQCNFKKLEGDAKWHRIQSVSHTLIFQVFLNITSVLEFVYSHFFTLYLICMWLLFIMPVIKLLFLTIVLPGDFVVARRAFWRETEMAILVARTNLPVWDFQKLASLTGRPASKTTDGPRESPLGDHMTRKDDKGDRFTGRPAKRWRDDLDKYWNDTIWQRKAQVRQANMETACWGLRPTTGHYGCPMMMMMMMKLQPRFKYTSSKDIHQTLLRIQNMHTFLPQLLLIDSQTQVSR